MYSFSPHTWSPNLLLYRYAKRVKRFSRHNASHAFSKIGFWESASVRTNKLYFSQSNFSTNNLCKYLQILTPSNKCSNPLCQLSKEGTYFKQRDINFINVFEILAIFWFSYSTREMIYPFLAGTNFRCNGTAICNCMWVWLQLFLKTILRKYLQTEIEM